VVRQVHHSLNNAQDAVDLVLFVNGIAVATAELKSDFTQSVGDAVDQYRFDRDPAPRAGWRSRCWPSPAARWCILR
jgi:type I restriction enzyme R subunit